GDSRNSASCCTFVIFQLAKQSIAVFLGPIRQVCDKVFDLLAGGFAQGLGLAKIDGIGLHQSRIKLVLTTELAQAVTDLRATVVAIGWLRWLLRLLQRKARFNSGAEFLDRADSDAVRLPQSTIYRPGFRYAHFSAIDQGRYIGGIGIAIANEPF